MKNILFLCLFMGMYVTSYDQVITIKDQENYQPLELVTMSSEDFKTSVITNAMGQADISAFRGSNQIEIRIIGYKPLVRNYDELEKADFLVYLSPSIVSLDQVVISATRWNQPRREIPVSITTISPKDVSLQMPQTAADLLSTSGEVFIQKSQLGGGSPMIRGFATNRLLISVDGVRMNTAIFRSGNLQNVISLDPFAIERTELLFGPGSVIYGSDAIAGVMCFHTLIPKLSLNDKPYVSGSAVARYSSANNERTGHFDVNVGWKKWALATSFSNFDFGDLRMGTNGPDEYLRSIYTERVDSVDRVFSNNNPLIQRPTGYSQINLMQKVRFKTNEKWDFNYAFHYSATSDYSRYDRLIRYRNGLPRSAEWYYGPQVWIMNNLDITHNAVSGIYDQLTIRMAHQFFKESRIDRNMNDPERRSRVEKVNAYSANLDFVKSIGLKNKLFYGAEVVYNDVNSTGTDEDINTGIVVTGPARYPQSNWSSYAGYLTCQYKTSEKLLFQAGARYNRFILDAEFDTAFYPFPLTSSSINNGALTGSLGFVYSPTNKWSLSTGLSTGFRSPNVDDVGKVFDSEPGSVVIPNPELNAEYVFNAEVGIAKVFGDFMRIDFTGFYTILQNALVRRNYTLNGQDSIIYDGELSQVQAIQNAAVANVYGIQAAVELKLYSGFGLSARFNCQKGEEELDDGTTSPLRHAAPWFGVFHITYSVQKLKLDLYTNYSGEVSYENLAQEERGKAYIYATDPNGNPYSPGWNTLNFKVMYQLTDHFSISSGIENLTDKRYRPYSSGIVAPGRNFILSLKAVF